VRDALADSYYAATANRQRTPRRLEGDARCDVVVIGGGFTGIAAALACAEKGFSVILLEAKTIGFGASGRNGGQLIPGLRWSMREMEAEFGAERAKAIFDVAWGARDLVWGRVARHKIDCDLTSGHLEAAYKPAHLADMEAEAELLETLGYKTTILDRTGLSKHIHADGYHGGLYDPQGGHFHPLNYVLGLAAAAEEAGVLIFENSRVAEVIDQGTVTVRTAQGKVRASHAILATDTWMDDIDRALGSFTIPIMNYNVATAPIPEADALLPSNAAVADSRFVLNYFRLSADKRLLFGGGEKYVQTPPADIGAFVRRHIVEVFQQLATTPIDYQWGGAVSVSMNRLPILGRRGNVFHAFGFSGHGALITTLAGELIAEALAGTASRFDVMASLPKRPFPGGKWMRRPLATLGLLWYALKDRL
jgi:gamma-glutamylputrescine oxidase